MGPEIDMWAFGICMYKMCVGYAPDQVPKFNYGRLLLEMEFNRQNRISSCSIHQKRLEKN